MTLGVILVLTVGTVTYVTQARPDSPHAVLIIWAGFGVFIVIKSVRRLLTLLRQARTANEQVDEEGHQSR